MKFISLISFLSFLFCAGCVSVSLPTGKGKKAENVRFSPPAPPFRDLESPGADHAWISDATGNTVSYLSDCGGKVDPPLAQLQSEAVDVLANLKVGEEKNLTFNGREAVLSGVSGDLDGVPMRMRVLTFKKNDCNYTITYAGVARAFEKEAATFANFLDGFKAP